MRYRYPIQRCSNYRFVSSGTIVVTKSTLFSTEGLAPSYRCPSLNDSVTSYRFFITDCSENDCEFEKITILVRRRAKALVEKSPLVDDQRTSL